MYIFSISETVFEIFRKKRGKKTDFEQSFSGATVSKNHLDLSKKFFSFFFFSFSFIAGNRVSPGQHSRGNISSKLGIGEGGFLDISNPCIPKTGGDLKTNMEVLGRLQRFFFGVLQMVADTTPAIYEVTSVSSCTRGIGGTICDLGQVGRCTLLTAISPKSRTSSGGYSHLRDASTTHNSTNSRTWFNNLCCLMHQVPAFVLPRSPRNFKLNLGGAGVTLAPPITARIPGPAPIICAVECTKSQNLCCHAAREI